MPCRPPRIGQLFAAMILCILLLASSGCFQVVEPGSLSGKINETSPVPTKTITVTVTPPIASPTPLDPGLTPLVSTASKLVGLWNFDDNSIDNSGSNNNGMIIGGATLKDSAPGFSKGLSSGIKSFGFKVDPSSSLNTSSDLMLEALVKLDSLPDRSDLITKAGPPPFTEGSYSLYITADGHLSLQIWKNKDATTILLGDTHLEIGRWYHVAGSYQYAGDGTSVMKVFVDDKIDGKLTSAVGPILPGNNNLSMGKLNGIIDEVHVWNSAYADYSVSVSPKADISNPGNMFKIGAALNYNVPEIKVHFEVLPGGNNSGQGTVLNTDNSGTAEWTYSDRGLKQGNDSIRVWIDKNSDGLFDESTDTFVIANRYWMNTFITAIGDVKGKNNQNWTFSGTAGIIDQELVGNLQLIDIPNKVVYKAVRFYPTNSFFQSNYEAFAKDPLPASAKIINFGGIFTNNLDASNIDLSIWMVDTGGADIKGDRISVIRAEGGGPGPILIGTLNKDWNPISTQVPYALPVRIDDGDIKARQGN